MSEVHRYSVVKMLSEAGNKISYDPHGPEVVMAKDYDALAAEAQALREEVAALRARVMVTPDASTVYAALDARERLFTSPENIRVALEAQSRLNGKTVSEGLLRLTLEFIMATNYKGSIPLGLIEELRALLNQDKENGNG